MLNSFNVIFELRYNYHISSPQTNSFEILFQLIVHQYFMQKSNEGLTMLNVKNLFTMFISLPFIFDDIFKPL